MRLLTYLGLDDNELKREIPKEIGKCTKLTQLNLCTNELNGTIPKEVGNCTALTGLALYNNQLKGEFPSKIGNCISLKFLILRNNLLTGEFPETIVNRESLYCIDMMQNNFTGDVIPSWLEPFHKKYTGTGDGKGLYSDWNMAELYLDKAQKAIASIRNEYARQEVTEHQIELFTHAKVSRCAKIMRSIILI